MSLVMSSGALSQGPSLGEAATHPFQYALSTRAGTECVTHIVQAMTSEDREATILSIDGISVYDFVSRNGDKLVPFMRLFNGSPSTFLWEDDEGTVHHVRQGEGGEQGDPLMPLLFGLGLHRALVSVKSSWRTGRSSSPSWMMFVSSAGQQECFKCSGCWNTNWAGRCVCVRQNPDLESRRGRASTGSTTHHSARMEKPDAVVWRGDPELPLTEQGLTVLGAPVGQVEFVQAQLTKKGAEHARANFLLRTVQPELTQEFARHHDEQLARCLRRVLHINTMPPEVQVAASMPLTLGGLGIGNAAHWGSWVDCFEMIKIRHPDVARRIVQGMATRSSRCFQAVEEAASRLTLQIGKYYQLV